VSASSLSLADAVEIRRVGRDGERALGPSHELVEGAACVVEAKEERDRARTHHLRQPVRCRRASKWHVTAWRRFDGRLSGGRAVR
jgi:hypothetical protein